MRLLIVGGKLQGTEAAYLAAKAGWETVLVDRREDPPAAGLADRQVVTDITADERAAKTLVTACDAVLPACEDLATLEWLSSRAPGWGVPLLFDLDAYRVTESKLASRRLFADLGAPTPRGWPSCGYPAVIKPSVASGSDGVRVVAGDDELECARAALEREGHEVVIEEYVPGPSLSLEVLAWAGTAVTLQVTGLEFDASYDCKRVVAPVAPGWAGGQHVLDAFDSVSADLARGLGLRGLMDVEVMVGTGGPRVLEIDARLPSQTPTAVYRSSGLNVLELLLKTVRDGTPPVVDRAPRQACVYEHVRASGGTLEVIGEHVMGGARPLSLVAGFFGADEALTDYRPGWAEWAATLVVTAPDLARARERAAGVVAELAAFENLDLVPEVEDVATRGARP